MNLERKGTNSEILFTQSVLQLLLAFETSFASCGPDKSTAYLRL